MPIKQQITGGRVPVKIYTNDIESSAYQQLENIARLPFIHGHVAAMPDVHPGIGISVGAVIPTRGAIIPAAVGVDIGCGMNALRLSLRADRLPDSLRRVRSAIEAAVPVGFAQHAHDVAQDSTVRALQDGLSTILDRHPRIANLTKKSYPRWVRQLGTLGGGNHFVELCLDQNGGVWLMLHSGSRGIGNAIGRYFIELAKDDMRVPYREPAAQGSRLLHRGHAPLRRLRARGRLGAGLCDGQPLRDDALDRCRPGARFCHLSR